MCRECVHFPLHRYRHTTKKHILYVCLASDATCSMQRYGSLQQFWLSSLIPDGANVCIFKMLLVILSVKILSGCIHSNSEVLLYVIVFCCFVVYFPSFLYFSGCDTTKGGYQSLAMSADKTDPKSYSNKFHNSEIPKFSGCSKLMQLRIVINIGKKESPFRST